MSTMLRFSKNCCYTISANLLFSSSKCCRSWITFILGGEKCLTCRHLHMCATSVHFISSHFVCFAVPLLFINTQVVAHSLQTMNVLCDSVSLVHLATVPEVLDTHISASKTVLKQGEPLSVNCTAYGVELVFFTWDYPNKDVSGPKNKLPHLVFIQLQDP